MMAEDDTCTTCGHTRYWHGGQGEWSCEHDGKCLCSGFLVGERKDRGEMALLKPCPRCGADGGLIYCEACHGGERKPLGTPGQVTVYEQ